MIANGISSILSPEHMRITQRTTDRMANILLHVENEQIGCSSYIRNHEPFNCRLNHPSSYWQPTINNEICRDVWLTVDFRKQTIITKILIQGSQFHDKYIKTLWIDSSDDGCNWKTHSLGEIQCAYKHILVTTDDDTSDMMSIVRDSSIITDDIHSKTTMDELFGTSVHPSSTSVIDMSNNSNSNANRTAIIDIWPNINSRFVRIRPSTYHVHCALRLDIYGYSCVNEGVHLSLARARVVSLDDTVGHNRKQLLRVLKNRPTDTKAIQIDCKAVITGALDISNMLDVGFLKTTKNNYVCIFTTADVESSESLVLCMYCLFVLLFVLLCVCV